MKTSLRAVAIGLMLLGLGQVASAQGLFVNANDDEHVRLPRPHVVGPLPREPQANYKIGELSIEARLQNQIAKVQVTQSFVNTGSTTLEGCLVFPLPYDGAIDRLTLLVDGKELPGSLLPKDQARARYEAIVRKNRDPALLEWIGHGMYQTSVFPIPPGATRHVTFRYTQVCDHDQGLTDFLFPLATARYTSQPLDQLHVRVAIETDDELKNVYSPTHEVEIERHKHRATVEYTVKDQVPTSDFRLMFDTGRDKLGASLLSYRPDADEDGYYLLLASPPLEAASDDAPRKTVVFVVDRSGSMTGKKIEQAREAAKFVLDNLRDGDLFNIIAYDDAIDSFRPELQKCSQKTRQQALGFIDGLYAGGSTNIDGALETALRQVGDSDRPSYILFLTDGLPTAGETNEMKIVATAKSRNAARARLIPFGVGYDVNSRLLDKLARENFGQSEYVKPEEDLEAHVSRLYSKLQSPVLTDVEITVELDGNKQVVNRVYPRDVYDVFAGQQLVLVGRYKTPGAAKVVIRGKNGERQERFDFPAKLANKSDESQAFVAKLWASRRIGEIIDQLDLKGKNQELIDELVALSTRYGILTPYTSFLADEETKLADVRGNTARADTSLGLLGRVSGIDGYSQRSAKASLQYGTTASAPAAAMAESVVSGAGNYRDVATNEVRVVNSVRQLGDRSFYFKGGRWIDSTASESQLEKPQKIEQFSDEYFRVIADQTPARNSFFTLDEPILLNLDGTAYLIEPVK